MVLVMKPLPHHCILCLGMTRRPLLCQTCQSAALHAPQRLAAFENCQPWEIRALGHFNGPLRALVLKLKHSRDGRVGEWLGRQLARQAASLPRPQAITWVPGQRLNRWRRGGDPAAHIAKGLADALNLPIQSCLHPNWSWHGRQRSRAQRKQAQLTVNPTPALRVWLVDDVFVTGATLAGATEALETAGVQVEQHFALCLG